MSIPSSPPAMERDLRIDFFRGLALFCIFIDHLPNNFVAEFTLQSVMFSDAAEVFILISGLTAGIVYGRAMERQGFVIAGVRVYHRVWQLYVAHVFLFMMFIAMVAYTAGALNNSLYAEEFGAANFLDEPGVAVAKASDLAVPAGLHAHSAALHRPACRPPFRTCRAPILAEGGDFRLLRALAGGPVRQTDRSVGLSWSGWSVAFQSVRLAGAVLSGGMARLARHSRRGFLARPSLAVLPRGWASRWRDS